MKGVCFLNSSLDIFSVNSEVFSQSIKDFFKNEYTKIISDLQPVFNRTAGPKDGKEFLGEVFNISLKAEEKGIIQKKLKELSQHSPSAQEVDDAILFFSDLDVKVLENMANLVYSIDEWLDKYRGQIIRSRMQVFTVNKVVEDGHKINSYIQDQHIIIFGTILRILEQHKIVLSTKNGDF